MHTEASPSESASEAPVMDFEEDEIRNDASDEVVVMEDDPRTAAYIVEALQTIGLKPHTVENAEEAVALAKKEKARCFILDANMGDEDRAQEGLEALTRIKKYDKSISVAMYSNHVGLLKKALRLADVTRPKSGDHLTDIVNIVSRLTAPHLKGLVDKLWGNIGHQSDSPDKRPSPGESSASDPNKLKYQELRANPDWVKNHLGDSVAIINGELVDQDTDRKKLLKRVRQVYSGKAVFLTEVKEHEDLVRIFSPLQMHDQ
jgi:DNA-binding response OmpR family regulator